MHTLDLSQKAEMAHFNKSIQFEFSTSFFFTFSLLIEKIVRFLSMTHGKLPWVSEVGRGGGKKLASVKSPDSLHSFRLIGNATINDGPKQKLYIRKAKEVLSIFQSAEPFWKKVCWKTRITCADQSFYHKHRGK